MTTRIQPDPFVSSQKNIKVNKFASTRDSFVNALLTLGLIGIFYPGIGTFFSWAAFILALFYYRDLRIPLELVFGSVWLICFLCIGALFSEYPLVSIRGISIIAKGLLMFIPAVFWGSRLSLGELKWSSFSLFSCLACFQLFSPRIYDHHFYFGFYSNPNIVGHGLVYVLFLLLVATASLKKLVYATSLDSINKRGLEFFASINIIAFGALLTLSNYRAGWLATLVFFVTCSAILSRELSLLVRDHFLRFCLALCGFIAAIYMFDFKGFGYGSVGSRLDLWMRSLDAWYHHFFLFGSGFNTFHLLGSYYKYGRIENLFFMPHNIVVEVLLSSGLWGLISIALYLIYVVRFFQRLHIPVGPIAAAAKAAVVGMIIAGQLDMRFSSFGYIGSLAAFAGILYAQRDTSSEQEDCLTITGS